MPFFATLAEMRPLVRSQAAVQRVRFVEDSDLNPWIVGAWVRLYDLYVMSGDPYFEAETDLTIYDGVPPTIPSNLYRLRRVDYLRGDQPEELRDLDVHEVARAARGDVAVGCARGYRLRASELQLPGAVAGQQYRVTYAPAPKEPRTAAGAYVDTQKMDMVDATGREWCVLQASVRCVQKQREDASGLLAEAAGLRRDLERKAGARTASRLRRVADTSSWQYEDDVLGGRR